MDSVLNSLDYQQSPTLHYPLPTAQSRLSSFIDLGMPLRVLVLAWPRWLEHVHPSMTSPCRYGLGSAPNSRHAAISGGRKVSIIDLERSSSYCGLAVDASGNVQVDASGAMWAKQANRGSDKILSSLTNDEEAHSFRTARR
jgi:hypothetical protein